MTQNISHRRQPAAEPISIWLIAGTLLAAIALAATTGSTPRNSHPTQKSAIVQQANHQASSHLAN